MLRMTLTDRETGDTGMKEYEARTNKPKRGALASASEPDWKCRMRVYFPSYKTVEESRGGTRVRITQFCRVLKVHVLT